MQLQFKDLVKLFDKLKEKYSIEEIMEMPIKTINHYNGYYLYPEKCFEKNKEIYIGEED